MFHGRSLPLLFTYKILIQPAVRFACIIIPVSLKNCPVSLPRHPLRINVGFLLNQTIGYSREIDFDYPQIRLAPQEVSPQPAADLLEVENLLGKVRINRTPQGLLFEGNFSGRVDAQCVRCLTETKIDLSTQFSELYAFSTRSATDSELLVPEDGNIDLEWLVREYLLVEIPISPLCRPDCKGLCRECGENLNLGTCEHVSRGEEPE